jgi:glutathione peroxidase
MKTKYIILLFIAVAIICSCKGQKEIKPQITNPNSIETIYEFKVKDIDGNIFDFSTLRGKKIMIVNVASKCGLTPQYKGLQELYTEYKDKGFIIIGFPANNFMKQEPGTSSEIKSFCTLNYGVTFPIMEKIDVKGENIHPVYQYLTGKNKNGLSDNTVKWNFQKYLINEKGILEKVIGPRTKPMSTEIVNWVKG